MSDPVVARTFPYRPSGGWVNEEIWGGPGAPDHDDVPDGATQETKERLKATAFSLLDSLVESFKYRIAPERSFEVGRAPGDVAIAREAPAQSGQPEVPTIRITGAGAQITRAGWLIVAGLGGLLLIGIGKERGVRA